MEKQESIDAWFALVPEQAKATARRLLLEVDNLRREEIIYPPQGDILNALAYVAPEDVRAVILGQDPYHGPGQAMGLSFSVPKGEKLPPSLRNIYKEMASDLGCSIPVSGDLSAWAQQGVLLLNTTLTVREHEANSHSKLGWQVVTTAIVEACMRLPQPVVFLAWGRPAIKVIESAKSRAAKDAFEGGACAGAADSGADDHASSGTAPAVADSSGSLAGRCPFPQVHPQKHAPLATFGIARGWRSSRFLGLASVLPRKRFAEGMRGRAYRLVACWLIVQVIPRAMRSAGSLKWLPGFDSNCVGTPLLRNAATTSSVPVATLRRSRLGVFASLLPSEKYAQSIGQASGVSVAKCAKSGYQSEPEVLAMREKADELSAVQVAKSPASE